MLEGVRDLSWLELEIQCSQLTLNLMMANLKLLLQNLILLLLSGSEVRKVFFSIPQYVVKQNTILMGELLLMFLEFVFLLKLAIAL